MGVPGVPDILVILSQETDHHRAESRRSQSALRRHSHSHDDQDQDADPQRHGRVGQRYGTDVPGIARLSTIETINAPDQRY
jgi:hypothetical protein